MLKIDIFVTSTKRAKCFRSCFPLIFTTRKQKCFRSSFPLIFTTRNAVGLESENVEDLWINYNPLVLRVKSPTHVCSNWDGF